MTHGVLQDGGVNPLDPRSVNPSQTPAGIGAEAAGDFGNLPVIRPADADEKVARKNGWKTFLQKLQTDEALQAQLFTIGTELLRPIQPGQTAGTNIATALQKGEAARIGVGERTRAAGLEERLVSAKEKTSARSGVSGGVAGRVQEINQMRDALQSSNPTKYPNTPSGRAKATLDAQKIIRSKTREERIVNLAGKMLIPGQDPNTTVRQATIIVDAAAAETANIETKGALPIPSNKEALVDGQLYQTSKGPRRWSAAKNGFVGP